MHKWKSYDVWFLRYGVWQTQFFLSLNYFLLFYSPNNPKNHNFDKMKKTTRDIIILYKCTINENHDVCFLRYEAWQTLLSFWAIFCPFTPLTTPKNQNFEKIKKNPGDIIILNKSNKNYDHMLYRSWDTVHDRCNFHFLFWAAFCPFKAPGYITILPMCTKN